MTNTRSKRVFERPSHAVASRRSRARAAGALPPAHIPSSVVQERISELQRLGMSCAVIASLSGVSHATVHKIGAGKTDRTKIDVARRIMSINRIGERPEGGMLPGFAAQRRIRALCRIGWRYEDIAECSGLRRVTVQRVGRVGDPIFPETLAKIDDAYRELSTSSGPSAITRRRAAEKQWPSPMDWETANIDDPTSFPDMRERVIGSRAELRTKKDQALRMLEAGVSRRDIASRLDVSLRTIERWARVG